MEGEPGPRKPGTQEAEMAQTFPYRLTGQCECASHRWDCWHDGLRIGRRFRGGPWVWAVSRRGYGRVIAVNEIAAREPR